MSVPIDPFEGWMLRAKFNDGEDEVLPLAPIYDQILKSEKRYKKLLKRRVLWLELHALDQQIEHVQSQIEAKKTLQNENVKRTAALLPRNTQLLKDHDRFVKALASYERIDLAPLLVEFDVPSNKRPGFSESNIATYLGIKNAITATQVRKILRDEKAREPSIRRLR